MKVQDRQKWGDVAKGIGIFLVVAAHVAPTQDGLQYQRISSYIFLFHMPLFFIISGYFFKRRSLTELIKARFSGLVVPYVAFVLLIAVLDTLISLSFGLSPQIRSVKSAAGIVLGGTFATEKYGVLWFVPCLLVTSILYGWVEMRGRMAIFSALIICALLTIAEGRFAHQIQTPLGIAQVPAAFLYFYFGGLLRQRGLAAREITVFVIATLLICYGAITIGTTFNFDMKSSEYGPPILGCMLAAALSTILIRVCVAISKYSWANWISFIGASSLTIMMLHQLVHFMLLSFGVTSFPVLLALAFLFPLAVFALLNSRDDVARVFLGRKVIPE